MRKAATTEPTSTRTAAAALSAGCVLCEKRPRTIFVSVTPGDYELETCGGEFVGGRVSPIGAVIGAMTLALAGSFLSFLRLNPDWQIGAQGAILIIVLALRVLISRGEARR